MTSPKARSSRRVRQARLVCPSGKSRYRSKDEALEHLHRMVHCRDRMPHRTYQCGKCHGWHLSSKEPFQAVESGWFIAGDGI